MKVKELKKALETFAEDDDVMIFHSKHPERYEDFSPKLRTASYDKREKSLVPDYDGATRVVELGVWY